MNTHEPKVCAFHEAGHAVYCCSVGWGKYLDHAQITPENPDEGGHTKLNRPERKVPLCEQLSEIGWMLSGPLTQIQFAAETIDTGWIERLRDSLLDTISDVEHLNAANVPTWEGDLRRYLAKRKLGATFFCQNYFKVEWHLQNWLRVSTVTTVIDSVANALLEKRRLTGMEIVELTSGMHGDALLSEARLARWPD